MATKRALASFAASLAVGFWALCLCSGAALAELSAAAEQALQRAKTLLQAGQAQAAYELLTQNEFDGAGDVEFDYTLGVAALDAGKPDKATLALDRVLAINPLHAGALVDRGRAYAALGNQADARADFEAALKLNPSEATRAQLQAFLAQLESAAKPRTPDIKGYLAATLGHDSNVNFAASERNIFVPLIADTIELAANSTRQSDEFLTLAGGASFEYPLSSRFAWFGGVDGSAKRNKDVSDFNLSSVDLRFGPSWSGDAQQIRAWLNFGQLQLGDEDYRQHQALGVELRYAFDATKQLLLGAQHTRLRYHETDTKLFDADQSVGLAGINLVVTEAKRAVLSPFVLLGRENAVAGNLQGDRKFAGGGLLGRYELKPTRSLNWSLGAQRGRYSETDPFFFVKRKDERFDATLALTQQLGKAWTIRPQISWTRQDSNIAPYDFKRVETSITLRREFD